MVRPVDTIISLRLHLRGSCVTDEALGESAKLKQLQLLNLTATKVTSAGATELKRALPNCHVYDRDGFEVHDTGNHQFPKGG
ncbi:MAG TPA: hypothetical protein VND64_37740 [Pirellulales bacterium]|nr:hypothetical protein [Pirellulales bacterium]